MKFVDLVEKTRHLPLFETGLLLAGKADLNDVRRQLSRWVDAGKVIQLRRGLYALAEPYGQVKPHSFYVANQMVRGSYVSLHSALSHYGLIPEYVPVVTSVHTGRPGQWETSLGVFRFQHVIPGFLRDFKSVEIVAGQKVYIAEPEKALLDLVHLTPGSDNRAWLEELRLQNFERLNMDKLVPLAEKSGKRKQMRAAKVIACLASEEEFLVL
ncbi:MAG: hypothetical protein QGG53_38500 [Planctomycetota bacterium]|nr:hypothetical protein [Planctomycetota bacterium]